MKKILTTVVFITAFALGILAQQTSVTEANYKLPARFSPDKLKKMVF